jgi:SAM-dependent methyltransferase
MSSPHYTKSFYERLRHGATRSAEAVVPLVLKLLPVHSVVDVGCGDGSWLATFQKLGVADILGIDGDYVERGVLQIPPELFRSMDLSKPIHLDRSFELAVSLEVAEHLPAECASQFVKSLTRLAPFVLFSAAIPFQGGDNHINEQWPDQWAGLFHEHGYLPVDFIRKQVWQNDSVDFWYAQNSLLFAQASLIESNPSLKAEFELTNPNQICLVHPRQYLYLENRYHEVVARAEKPITPSGVTAASRLLWLCLMNAFKKRMHSILGKEARF